MTLILRKCEKDGHSRNGFYYGQIGERVICPDWESYPKCGNGLHGLKEGSGNWSLLIGNDWLIIDADDQIVDIDDQKCKFNTGIIKYRGNPYDIIKSEEFHEMARKSDIFCYNWAFQEGIHANILANYISSSKFAYLWARDIGNQDLMINKINDSYYAFYWARNIGNQDVMMNKITDSCYAYYWAINIGNRDIMIDKVVDSEYAYKWAIYIGNKDIMKAKITEDSWIEKWNSTFSDNLIESN